MAESKKLIKDGQVAVIVSPGYGAGWSTWNSDYGNQLLFDPDIAESLLAKDAQKAMRIASERYPDVYTGGAPEGQSGLGEGRNPLRYPGIRRIRIP